MERRTFTGFRRVEVAPGAFWVQPAGDPFSFRIAQTSRYAGVVLSLDRIRAMHGMDIAIEPAYSLSDGSLAGLVQALTEETRQGGKTGRLFADGVAAALVARLAHLHGNEKSAVKGGVGPRRLRHVIDFIDAHLAESLALDVLAGLAGLSPFHFARAFKRSTGRTPHRFVLERRLDRARELLANGGCTVTEAAYACGFADHAHLSRAFRQRFGIAPSTIAATPAR